MKKIWNNRVTLFWVLISLIILDSILEYFFVRNFWWPLYLVILIVIIVILFKLNRKITPDIKMRVRHYIIVILATFGFITHSGFWLNTNPYENIIIFFVFTLPFVLILLIISLISRKKDVSISQKNISTLGIYFSLGILGVIFLHFMYISGVLSFIYKLIN